MDHRNATHRAKRTRAFTVSAYPVRQRGIALVLVVVGFLAVLAMAGLALDASHLGYNKARLQTAVDAAALSAAKVLDQTNNTTDATATARATMSANATTFKELATALSKGLEITVQFSSTAVPFVSGSTPARFVRVVVPNFETDASLTRILGILRLPARASAVAGPSPPISYACNIAPIAACANTSSGAPYYGYTPGTVYSLREQGGIGTGNFSFLSMEGNGASVLKTNLAGGYSGCATIGQNVDTKPGQSTGPVSQGLNTRFNKYKGGGVDAATYPPDVILDEPSPSLTVDKKTGAVTQGGKTITLASQLSINHAQYDSDIAEKRYDIQPRPAGTGAFLRRELAVPLVNCSDVPKGRTSLPVVGYGCFFMLQQVDDGIFAEFISDCEAGGRVGPVPPGNSAGPHVIQLYRDFSSVDS